VLPVVALDGVDLRALTRDRDGGVADLKPGEPPAEASVMELAQKRAVAAADLERARGADLRARTQREHVIGLADGAERAPACIDESLRGAL
jgi:hypothetical protein